MKTTDCVIAIDFRPIVYIMKNGGGYDDCMVVKLFGACSV